MLWFCGTKYSLLERERPLVRVATKRGTPVYFYMCVLLRQFQSDLLCCGSGRLRVWRLSDRTSWSALWKVHLGCHMHFDMFSSSVLFCILIWPLYSKIPYVMTTSEVSSLQNKDRFVVGHSYIAVVSRVRIKTTGPWVVLMPVFHCNNIFQPVREKWL